MMDSNDGVQPFLQDVAKAIAECEEAEESARGEVVAVQEGLRMAQAAFDAALLSAEQAPGSRRTAAPFQAAVDACKAALDQAKAELKLLQSGPHACIHFINHLKINQFLFN